MPFISDTNAVQFTQADWVEIACAIESKIHAIERGFYDEGPGEEWPGLASNSAWILLLHEILEKLGPDGVFAVEDGVLPVQDPDAG
jgi:hypothetical protein